MIQKFNLWKSYLIQAIFFLRSNDFTEWIFTFLPTFQTISKKGWEETPFLFFWSFFLQSFSYYQNNFWSRQREVLEKLIKSTQRKRVSTHPFLEIVWKVGKKVNIHFVKSFLLKKNCLYRALKWNSNFAGCVKSAVALKIARGYSITTWT